MLGGLFNILSNTYLWTFLLVVCSYYARKWYKKRRKRHSLFKRLGIPFAKPHLIYGNFHSLKRNPKQCEIDTIGEWRKKYGKIFGYFVGEKAYISISDLDLVKKILIQNFFNFVNRPPLAIKADPVIHSLVGLKNEKWKYVRSLLTPTFSSSKIKLMIYSMNSKVDIMLQIIEQSDRKAIDFYKLYQGFTLDVISECALAMQTNCQRDQTNDVFLTAVKVFMKNAINPAITLAIYFPPFAKFLEILSNNFTLSARATYMIKKNVREVILERRNHPSSEKMDILQLMLDAAEDDKKKDEKSSIVKRKLTQDEIIANAWTFILAGFETSTAALAYTTYLLAKHPQIQEKLYDEICKSIQSGHGLNHFSYDDVFTLQYLDQVINESLRLYPPVVSFISREAKEDILFDDLLIPKGTCVSIPVWQIHHDPELWPDPEIFDPERFSLSSKLKENRHPMSFIPFGEGPRKCIGMRFAQMEVKLAIARLISVYKIEICDKTTDCIKFKVLTVTLIPKEEIFLRATKREKT